jgi:N-acetylmuramoyl-L-alanine amidase
MPSQHTVAPGEHLTAIAAAAGFGDTKPILQHPDNAELAKRPHPTILEPGEQLTLPDLAPKTLGLATGKAHKIVVERPPAKLKLALKTFRGSATAATEGKLTLGDQPPKPVTLDGGAFEEPLVPTLESALLAVTAPDDKGPEIRWQLRLGHLGRSESEEGALARLRNLGYYRAVSKEVEPRERKSAIEEFQADQGMKLSGELDDATKAKIAEIHGC